MQSRELKRRLSAWDAAAIVVGTIIGSGIFIVPGAIARTLPSPEWMLGIWVTAGLLSLCGALAFAELGAMFPHTGGQYVYLREAYSPWLGFLFSWVLLLVVRTGGIAALAAGFAIYLGYFVPLPGSLDRLAAAGIVLLLASLNYCTVVGGAMMQKVTTFLKVAGLLLVTVGALVVRAAPNAERATLPPAVELGDIGVAMIACLWAYNGWYQVGFVGGEIRDPRRNLPLSLAAGVGGVVAIYLLANVAYMNVLSVNEIASTDRVAAVVAERVFGPAGATIVSVTILVSILGALNAGLLAGPRVYFALARDGLLFRKLAEVHPRFETPHAAIALQGVWAAILSLAGSYVELFSFAMFAAWIFYGLTVLGVVILRVKRPEWERPYRMWGYPLTPVLFAAASLWLVVSTLVTTPLPSLAGLLLIASGIPAYVWWRKRTQAV